MKTTGRFVTLTLVLALGLVACTGDGGKDGTDGGKTGGGSGEPTETISVPPGSSVYRYANAGLVAVLDLDADTLEIQNESGHTLPKPSFYVLAAGDGARTDGKVADATEVADAQTATFDVSLAGIDPKDIGLVVLLMGKDNYGAFVQQ